MCSRAGQPAVQPPSMGLAVPATMLPQYRGRLPEGAMHYLKRFYYGTARSASRYPLNCLRERAGPSGILFGSDDASVPEAVGEPSVRRPHAAA